MGTEFYSRLKDIYEYQNSVGSLLPFTHATSWSNFCGIIKDGYLRPSPCRVFSEELLYFFCGSVARRASNPDIPWGRSESPVILVFSPILLERLHRFFPVDTGALASGCLSDALLPWKKRDFRKVLANPITINNTPWHFIKKIYGSSKKYLAGEPISNFECSSFQLELALWMANEGSLLKGVDYRRYSLECQTWEYIPLLPYLREVWIPSVRKVEWSYLKDVQELRCYIYPDGKPPQSIF
jgi:hypothetical protein